jgi:peptidoglycan/xylan/chitin deacetylase (PgdA/CDA1 family)
MQHLADRGYHVLPLEEAVERLSNSTLPRLPTVLTIDDGWYGTYSEMLPVLKAHGFPSTLYVSTYYVRHQKQVFNVAVAYVLWKARNRRVRLPFIGVQEVDLDEPAQMANAVKMLSEVADKQPDADARQQMLCQIGNIVGYDVAEMESRRLIAFMNESELAQAHESRMDLQLHTHRHRFPSGQFELALREIDENRRSLDQICPAERKHFCFPSGEYEKHQLPWLTKMEIDTATTTRSGLNGRSTPRLQLCRLLDSDSMTDLDFEAELSGFLPLARKVVSAVTFRAA